MTNITYKLENYQDRPRLTLVVTNGGLKTSIKSKELDVSLKLRTKGDYHWSHFWVKPGAYLLSKLWKKFDLKIFRERFSSTIGKTLYVHTNAIVIRNKVRYVNVSYDHLQHELRHCWQKEKYWFFFLRYGIFKKFRLKMEIDANIYEIRDKLTLETKDKYRERIANSLTSGMYFANIDREFVEQEIEKQMRQFL